MIYVYDDEYNCDADGNRGCVYEACELDDSDEEIAEISAQLLAQIKDGSVEGLAEAEVSLCPTNVSTTEPMHVKVNVGDYIEYIFELMRE